MAPDEALLSPPHPRGQSHATNLQQRRDKQNRRHSLRLRPSDILENAEPPSPLNLSVKSGTSSRTTSSKMSLFSLFSRPKVEKQRGYAERGLEVPNVPPLPAAYASASTPDLTGRIDRDNVGPRAPSRLSGKTTATKSKSNLKIKESQAEKVRRADSFSPPPLFQAYPQSTKDGKLEVSSMSTETIHYKTIHKKGSGLQVVAASENATEDGSSFETRRPSTLKHVKGGHAAHADLPKKIFVLVTSGYLLQYAEDGPSDRLPERMLHLGKESAAFACDLMPGKHYVLQVSQAVDEDGVIVVNSGSILSKLGIRSAASKRMTSSFVLVMPNAEEMKSWMMAIRREIEVLGGEKVRPDTAIRTKNDGAIDNMSQLKKVPSQSHRYQIKRNPSKVASVISPVASPKPDQTTFVTALKIEENKSDDDTATLDGIEIEADKLNKNDDEPVTRNRSPSEAPSMAPTAVSVEQQQLNNLRSSLSTRASQTGTVATTVETSGPNSLAGSPTTSNQLKEAILEESIESGTSSKQAYRSSVSYSGNNRRSIVPSPATRNVPTLPTLNTTPPKARYSTIEESPVTGHHLEFPSPPKQKRLTTAQSEPNFHATTTMDEKHDSKVLTPPPVPSSTTEDGDISPKSTVGDLPTSSTINSSRIPSRRTSLLQSNPVLLQTQQPDYMAQRNSNRTSLMQQPASREQYKARRISSFSMPLKVNPSGQYSSSTSTENVRRRSQLNDPDNAGDSPTVHTLTAKVDPLKRSSTIQNPSVSNSPNAQAHQRSPSNRLSLFPGQAASPNVSPLESPQRSPSIIGQQSYSQAQATARQLRRPTSMQVRSDHAPFLSSVRSSTGSTTTVPIRGMKPSRSASNVASLAQSSPPEAFKGLKFDTEPVSEDAEKVVSSKSETHLPRSSEDADTVAPLGRAISPLPKLGQRASMRRGLKTRSSLPELDFGIPVVGLGPPAPPPSAPLPLPPPSSRTTSPTPSHRSNAGIESVAGLGISVS